MSVQDYKPIKSAPQDGTVVLVLAGSRYPRSAYFDKKQDTWYFWHSVGEDCNPDYWTELPAHVPSDYLPDLKTQEDLESHRRELGISGPPIIKKVEEKKVEPAKAPSYTLKPPVYEAKAAPAMGIAKKPPKK